MARTRAPGNASLLLLVTSAIGAACGGGTVVAGALDAGADGSSADAATADGGGDAGALADAPADDAADAAAPDCGCAATCYCRVLGPDAASCICSVRRPFLVGASMRSARAAPHREWSRAMPPAAGIDQRTRDALACVWLRDALDEHASIAAFARLTMHLLAVGAPPDLVALAQRASLDELRHARFCFALAERYGGSARGPAPLAVHDAMADTSLEAIAALTAEEGCVGETLGASLAAAQAAAARDGEVAAGLASIAADEARHAALAWRFAAWAARRGGARVLRAIEARAERAIQASLAIARRDYDGVDLDSWRAHGRLSCDEARAVVDRAVREVVRPSLAALAASVATRVQPRSSLL